MFIQAEHATSHLLGWCILRTFSARFTIRWMSCGSTLMASHVLTEASLSLLEQLGFAILLMFLPTDQPAISDLPFKATCPWQELGNAPLSEHGDELHPAPATLLQSCSWWSFKDWGDISRSSARYWSEEAETFITKWKPRNWRGSVLWECCRVAWKDSLPTSRLHIKKR